MQLFLAIAHHRLGHADQAKEWLRKADEQMKERQQDRGRPLSWEDKVRLELLRQEAGDILELPSNLKGQAKPTDADHRLRDQGALAQLPDAERQACRELWADMDALLKRTGR
jgi:hypothetical protein